MKTYRISARCIAHPAPLEWREQLATRLGGRPRRLGKWAELGMYGALECLERNDEQQLSNSAALILSSRHGPAQAVRSAMEQASEGLPLPLTFLQTQPSQLLAALSAQLQWCGDARFFCHPEPLTLLRLALAVAQEHNDGLLIGWVDELKIESSIWMRLNAVADPGGPWQPARDFETLIQHCSHVRLESGRLDVLS